MINTRVREAVRGDASQMVLLLNDIIQVGGSTAHQTNFDEDKMINHYLARAGQISCQVAITNGRLSGFQSLMRPDHANDPMPDGWGIIASFVALEKSGLGIGQKLFSATRAAARAAGIHTIDATIRADNEAGLRYYGGLGFADYDEIANAPLTDGTRVTRIRKKLEI